MIEILKSKIHLGRITERNIDYEGSITIDKRIAELANLKEYEKVLVADVDNGERFETYVIYGNDGEICVNGAAAKLVRVGDRVIIMSFMFVEEDKIHKPVIIRLDENNKPL
uniref:Aspartate 1-decarboxylase n=1 Tax=candidate division WOR-3 bacterium TaxID=2052148 RepID=A0A7C4UBG9_UNCW3